MCLIDIMQPYLKKGAKNNFYTFNIQNKTKVLIKPEYQFEIHITITKGSQFYWTNLTIALYAPKQTVMKSLVICITYWTFQIKFFTKIHRCFQIFFSKMNYWVHFLNTSGKTFFTELARSVPKICRGLLSHRQSYTPCVDSKHYLFSKTSKTYTSLRHHWGSLLLVLKIPCSSCQPWSIQNVELLTKM